MNVFVNNMYICRCVYVSACVVGRPSRKDIQTKGRKESAVIVGGSRDQGSCKDLVKCHQERQPWCETVDSSTLMLFLLFMSKNSHSAHWE